MIETETYAWGWNGCGQLGLDHEEEQHRPQVTLSLNFPRMVLHLATMYIGGRSLTWPSSRRY
jgi:alpha-tubulin suppressor-like RCC1 family protein